MQDNNFDLELLNAMNSKLIKEESIYRSIIDASGIAYSYYSFLERKTEYLGNWEQFFGLSSSEFESISQIMDLVDEEQGAELYDCLFLERRGKEKDTVDFHVSQTDKWIELETTVVYDAGHNPIEKIYCFKDITKYRKINDELSYMAYYDSLTGLLNRNCFVKILGEMIDKANENNTTVSVLFMDIDEFRHINDTLGIIVGDEVIQRFGAMLRDIVNENVRISHFSSDIFCVAIYDPCGARSAEAVIDAIKGKIHEPIEMSNGADVNLSLSIGVAEYPECSNDALELINFAEIVMFKAKYRGKNNIQYFDEPIIKEFIESVELEQKMDKALKAGQFFMCYQPQYDADTQTLRGVEALIRWRDESGKIIAPGAFIPIAERTGTILQLGEFVIDRSLSDYSVWFKKYGRKDIVLSINISALQFKSKNFIDYLSEHIKKYDIPASCVELEITESVFIDDMEDIVNKMNTLREMGFRFSMDDFGTGFSSLSYLRSLPIDTLKIDKSFVDTVVTDGPTRTIAEAIIDLSKKLGFDTIAEGVEEEVQYSLLKNIGCENIQGFYFGRPMNVEDVEVLYKES